METLRGTIREFKVAPDQKRSWGIAVVQYETPEGLTPGVFKGTFHAGMKPGDWFLAKGIWEEGIFRERKEITFNSRSIKPDLPVTPQGVRELLARTFTTDGHGIDPKAIAGFVERHGGEAAKMVERDPKMLFEMCADPARFGQAILRDWGRRNSGRLAANIMETAGLPPRAVESVLEAFRDDAINVLRDNPYRLATLPDVGFALADKVGQQMGVPADDQRRVAAAVADAIGGTGGDGHTYTPLSDMSEPLRKHGVDAPAIKKLIQANQGGSQAGVKFDIVEGSIIAQREALCEAEQAIASRIAAMVGRRLPPDYAAHIDQVTRRILSKDKYSRLDDIQKNAVAASARESIAILTGGPGTGKSTVSEAIADIAEATSKGPLILMAPTGKAARRLKETTGREAQTVHRALGALMEGGKNVFTRNRNNPLDAGCFVVVDESSMLDVETAAALLDALPPDGRLLLVGDRFQLPSVGPGYVLGDMLAARAADGTKVQSSELINVYRQGKNSAIAKGAALFKNGEVPPLDNLIRGGVVLYEHKTPMIVDRIASLMKGPIQKQLGFNPLMDVAVLCPQAPGAAGTWEINSRLSAELNPYGARIEGVAHGPYDDRRMPLPRVGDRVMLTKNDPENEVMNGDVGTLVDTFVKQRGGREQRMLKVAFDSGEVVDFPATRWRELIPAYAITGHKSQGSQYPLVIMPLTMQHAKMLERTLVYTEWTRAQDMLMLVGEREALELAAETVTGTMRRTRLRGLLESALEGKRPEIPAPSPYPASPARPARRGLAYRAGGTQQDEARPAPEAPPGPPAQRPVRRGLGPRPAQTAGAGDSESYYGPRP